MLSVIYVNNLNYRFLKTLITFLIEMAKVLQDYDITAIKLIPFDIINNRQLPVFTLNIKQFCLPRKLVNLLT